MEQKLNLEQQQALSEQIMAEQKAQQDGTVKGFSVKDSEIEGVIANCEMTIDLDSSKPNAHYNVSVGESHC
jgi:hypothetical protein